MQYPNITIGELFCGAGVGAVGSKNLKLEHVYAYDNNKHAVNTYNKNISNIATVEDLKNKTFRFLHLYRYTNDRFSLSTVLF